MFHLFDFAGHSRHFLATAAVHDYHLLNTKAPSHSSGVNSGIAATYHRDPPSQLYLDPVVDLLQEVEGVEDSLGVLTGNSHPLTHARTCGEKDGPVTLVEHLGQVLDRAVCLHLYAQVLYVADVVIEHLFRQSVFRNAPA